MERKNRKQGSYKVKKEHIKFIKDTLKKNNIIHMNHLQQLIINKYPTLKISRQYLSDIIRDNNITIKWRNVLPPNNTNAIRVRKTVSCVLIERVNV